jgi:hypothetical protein
MHVDASIAAQIAAGKLRKIEAVMEDRPQHTFGEAVVVFLIICGREIGDDVSEPTLLDCPGSDLFVN